MDLQETKEIPEAISTSHSIDDYYCDDYDGEYDDYNRQDLIKCGNCGNIWDGYAQCNCYQLECYRIGDTTDDTTEDTEEDTEEETVAKPNEKPNEKTTEDTIDTTSK